MSATAQDKVSAVGDAVSGAPGAAKEKTRGNPLAAGLIAFGAGTARVSALIPSTQKEREAVSELQSNLEPLKEKATEAAKEIGENLRGPAQEAAESVKSTATEGVENVKARASPPRTTCRARPRSPRTGSRSTPARPLPGVLTSSA